MSVSKPLHILLVHPGWRGFGNRKKIKVSEERVHPITLGVVAGTILRHDPRHRVRIVDQNNERVPYESPFDLVGITVNTYTAPAAYEIAKQFKERGVPVILGGVHATFMAEECLRHADAVVAGEAEEELPKLLDDFVAGELKPIYKAAPVQNMGIVPRVERGLFRGGRAVAAYVQATRGCSNVCKFCYLQSVGWGTFRARPVGEVLSEVRDLAGPIVLFVDDNMFASRDYCLELFSGLRKLGKHWWAQAPTTLARDKDLLSAAAASGCFSLSYGFQTVNRNSLAEDRILQNRIEDYVDTVQETQRNGILVDGTFIFGFDSDTEEVFEHTVSMILKMRLDTYTLYMMTAYPGTRVFEDYKRENRLVSMDWGRYDWDHAVVRPRQMSAERLEAGVRWAYAALDREYRKRYLSMVLKNLRFALKPPALATFLLSSGRPRAYQNNY